MEPQLLVLLIVLQRLQHEQGITIGIAEHPSALSKRTSIWIVGWHKEQTRPHDNGRFYHWNLRHVLSNGR